VDAPLTVGPLAALLPPVRGHEAGAAGAGAWLMVRSGERELAVRADAVREIAAPPRLARVPRPPPWLLGLALVGGRVVPVIDLSGLLGPGFAAAPGRPLHLVVLADGRDELAVLVETLGTRTGPSAGATAELLVGALVRACRGGSP
jgi:hypothetical protein